MHSSNQISNEVTGNVMRRDRLRWHGHVERKDGADYVKACTRLVVDGMVPVGRPRKTWQNSVCRHASPESRPPGYSRPKEMESHRTA